MYRVGAAALLIALTAGCASKDFSQVVPATVPSTTVTGTVPSPEFVARYAHRFPKPRPGYLPVSPTAPGEGPLTASSLSASAPVPAASRALLQLTGFLDGFHRTWVRPDFASGYGISLYRFADTSGAELYLRAAIDDTFKQSKGGSESTVDSTPGAPTIIESGAPDQYHDWWQVSVVRSGTFVVAVRLYSRNPIGTADVLTAIADAAVHGATFPLKESGTGNASTETLALPATWDLHYSYRCPSTGSSHHFVVEADDDTGTHRDVDVTPPDAAGGGVRHVRGYPYPVRGSLIVQSDCSWTIEIDATSP